MKINDLHLYLLDHRKQRGWTILQMAEKARLSNCAISRIETSKAKITMRSLYLILNACGITYQELCRDFNLPYSAPPSYARWHETGVYIHLSRKQKGISLRKLGKLSEISHPSIAKLERGLMERILFRDLLALDVVLDLHGGLLAMGWGTVEKEFNNED
jgi:transcriptional regulator with XRE-family HTH domain